MGKRSALTGLAGLLVAAALAVSPTPGSAAADVPAPGASKKIDEIKERGVLRVAVLAEPPWLAENTTGSGPQYYGSAWVIAEEVAARLGAEIEVTPVSHETKIPILGTGQVDLTIAPLAMTEERKKVVDFVQYSNSSLCFYGLASNPKLADVNTVDDLNRPELTMAYLTGTPPETWAPKRFPNMQFRGVQTASGANGPIEEILSGRADVGPIDNVVWPRLNASQPGLVVYPKGEDCLRSTENALPIGFALDKGDPVFQQWLTDVTAEIKDKYEAEEIRVMKMTQ
jgi:polar amino acid transport system substrate-binding protein